MKIFNSIIIIIWFLIFEICLHFISIFSPPNFFFFFSHYHHPQSCHSFIHTKKKFKLNLIFWSLFFRPPVDLSNKSKKENAPHGTIISQVVVVPTWINNKSIDLMMAYVESDHRCRRITNHIFDGGGGGFKWKKGQLVNCEKLICIQSNGSTRKMVMVSAYYTFLQWFAMKRER